MFSYWVNHAAAGADTFFYHLVNVLVHIANACLVFIILRRLLQARGIGGQRREFLSIFGAGLFLLHPVQTESVAYIAGRSESLCAFFVLGALAIFVTRPLERMTWRAVIAILVMYGCAVGTKEHAVVLPAAFLLVDVLLHRRTMREALMSRRRLYASLGVLGVAGAIGVSIVLMDSASAGFGLQDFTWYEYFFTQWRIWWLYAGLLFFPVRQNADYDLAVSHSPLEHGALLALMGMVAIAAAAWKFRNRYPLVALGLALCALFLAPTSSVVPIKDVAAERRLYLPMLGFILVLLEWVNASRLRLYRPTVLACLLVVAAFATYRRAEVWSGTVPFWNDVVAKSPDRLRGYAHLVYGYLAEQKCREADDFLSVVPARFQRDPELLVSRYHVYNCLGRKQDAVAQLEEAISVAPSVGTYVLIGFAYESTGEIEKSQQAFAEALRLKPQTPFDRLALERLRNRQTVPIE
jgi:tetratricopeptide (TPR) repeat protein